MGYISKPKITPDHVSQQLVQKSTNPLGDNQSLKAPNEEALMLDDAVRHPVTQRFTRQYQNQQSAGKGKMMDRPSKDAK